MLRWTVEWVPASRSNLLSGSQKRKHIRPARLSTPHHPARPTPKQLFIIHQLSTRISCVVAKKIFKEDVIFRFQFSVFGFRFCSCPANSATSVFPERKGRVGPDTQPSSGLRREASLLASDPYRPLESSAFPPTREENVLRLCCFEADRVALCPLKLVRAHFSNLLATW